MSANVTRANGRNFKLANFVGESVAIVGKELRPSIPTEFGPKAAYKCDVFVLTGTSEGTYFEDVLLFAKSFVEMLTEGAPEDRPFVGAIEKVATSYKPKAGEEQGMRYELAEPSSLELRLAARYGL